MRIFADLAWFFRMKKWNYLSGIIVLAIIGLLELYPPYAVGRFVDAIHQGTLTHSSLIQAISIILGVAASLYGLRFLWRLWIFGSSLELSRLLRQQLYEHFTKMSPQFFHQKRMGDLMAHATNDVQAVEATAGQAVMMLVDSLMSGGFVIFTMAATLNWKLTILVLIPMPFMAWSSSHYGKLMHERFIKAQAAFSDINDKVQENISGVRVVKAFGQEEVENAEFQRLSEDVFQKNLSVAKIDALFEPTISFIVGISFFLAVSVGSVFVVHRALTIGQLTTFTIYLGRLIWPMMAFGWLFNIVQRGRASYDRIREMLTIQPEITDRPGAMVDKPTGRIQFEVDSFTYPNKQNPTLTQLYVDIEKGQTLGVVGKTGVGKTTLFKLLLREFDCVHRVYDHEGQPDAQDGGDIWFGEHSIYEHTLDALRASIAYVPQDHFLFSASIAENIGFGKAGAPLKEIQRVAELAAVHDDIIRFPEGYGTMVGERGVTLSGGQKQRISIARALLLDAEVLILDDALSAVDAKTEAHIIDAIRVNRKNKTTFIATHRLSAVEHADVIIVLEDGAITEQGTHEELLNNSGWYSAMYQRQQLESLVEQGGVGA